MVDALPLGPLDEPAFEAVDPRFATCFVAGTKAERLWTGGRWVEGPAWLPGTGELVWSDIPGNRMLAWSETKRTTRVFRQPSAGANGNTTDRKGRLVTCEQYTRRITRTEADGTIAVLADRFAGKRFTAPNDIVEHSDGSIWFTDPDYGKSPEYEGVKELETCQVYRIAPDGAVRQMTDDMVMPNGLAFSPDERALYIVDTGSTHIKDGPNHIRRFDVGSDGTLGGGEVIAVNAAQKFDGLRVDTQGRLWCGAEDGVHVLLGDGTLIGRVRLPERASNLCFGGADRRTLFMTGTTSLYAVGVAVDGAR